MRTDLLPPLSRPTVREVLAQLEAAGVLPPDGAHADAARRALAAAARKDAAGAPWFVHLLVAVGCLVAMGLLLLFLRGVGLVDSARGAVTLGALGVGSALALRRAIRSELVGPAALTLALGGEALVIGGVGALTESLRAGALTAVVLEAALFVAFPDRVHRFLSVLLAAAATAVLLFDVGPRWTLDVLAVALAAALQALLLARPGLEARAAPAWAGPVWVGPAVAGLAASLFGLLVFGLMVTPAPGERLAPLGPLATMGLAGVLLVGIEAIARELARTGGGARPGPAPLLAAAVRVLQGTVVLLAALTLRTPGLLAALGVLALAFHRRDTVLLGLAVVFVLVFGAAYYSQLSLTLLAKSGVLVSSGLVLLAAWAALVRLARPPARGRQEGRP